MSVETPYAPETAHSTDDDERRAALDAIAARVAAWTARDDADPPDAPDALDDDPRRRAVLDPSATRIGVPGHPEAPESEGRERRRALHQERHAELATDTRRARRLDVARVAQAVCSALDLTTWERDRVLGVVCELDPAAFGGERTAARVTLVVARRVVDAERRAHLGLDEGAGAAGPSADRLAALADRLHRLTDGGAYDRLLAECGLTADVRDRIEALLAAELDESDREAALGRSPYRDPALPPFEPAAPGRED